MVEKFKKYLLPVTILVLFVTIAFSIFMYWKFSEAKQDLADKELLMRGVIEDSHRILDINGEQLVRTNMLEATNAEYLREMRGKDAKIDRLLELTETYAKELKKGGMVMTGATKGEVKGSAKTEVEYINKTDTVGVPIFPVYRARKNFDNWVNISSIATKDSTHYELAYIDSIDVVVGREVNGVLWWKKTNYFADLNSRNPYNKETFFRAVSIQMPKKTDRFVFGLGATTGLTQLNNNFGLGWSVGATATINLFGF